MQQFKFTHLTYSELEKYDESEEYNIYISSKEFLNTDPRLLIKEIKRKDIRLIVNTAIEVNPSNIILETLSRANALYVNNHRIQDSTFYGDISPDYLDNVVHDILQTNHKNILIHCASGINRSVMVACALLWTLRSDLFIDMNSVVNYVRQTQIRDRMLPALLNEHFIYLLLVYESKVDIILDL